MQNWSTVKRIGVATLVAGTLDILAAIGLTLAFGRKVDAMLRYVASGPFPGAKDWGAAGAATGLAVHFALMVIMAAVFVLAADRMPQLKTKPIQWGVIYGLVTYVAMNLIAVPLRFGTFPVSAIGISTQLFCHIVLVGIPIALIARR
ncbi:hypothetical protein OK349_02925 [Sphingomonas sp. BT-65]|uniref:hypothetical protein n=1 Tax=Sphingomonas sp. BT-65 TaxID=2989821 RepID=UPI0022360AD7|nr:hypothetical protein [Sphingomonas sp. BT-65]MCW4460645.1 hypothetical protein [Sphingomonas sp. BT-65]